MRIILVYTVGIFNIIIRAPKILYRYHKYCNKNSPRDYLNIYKLNNNVFNAVLKAVGASVEVVGEENLEGIENGFLIVSNHQSYFDIPLISTIFERNGVSFVSKDAMLKVPLISKYMKVMNCLFLDRNSTRAGIQMIKDGNKLLEDGVNLSIFPEGTRTKDGSVSEFKAGSLKIATRVNRAIVPVSISHSFDLNPSSKKMCKSDVRVIIHKPITEEVYSNYKPQELNDLVEEVVRNGVEI